MQIVASTLTCHEVVLDVNEEDQRVIEGLPEQDRQAFMAALVEEALTQVGTHTFKMTVLGRKVWIVFSHEPQGRTVDV